MGRTDREGPLLLFTPYSMIVAVTDGDPYCGRSRAASLPDVSRQRLGPWRWSAVLLFGYVLARPVSSNQVLVPVLAVLACLAVGTILVARRRLAGPLIPVVLTTFAFGFTGLAAGPTNPGAIGGILVFLAAPLLYWMVATAVDERLLRAALGTAAVVTVFIGTTIALFAAQSEGKIPALLPSWLLDQYGAGFGGTSYTEVRFYGLSTLVATGPMWVASLFVGKDPLLPAQWLRALAAVAAIAGTLAGGRRALALVLVLAPLVAWLVWTIVSRQRAERSATGRVVVAGVVALLAVDSVAGQRSGGVFGAAWQSLASYAVGGSLPGATAADDRVRTYQAERLLDEWSQAPLFGHGFGATVQGFARDMVEPWRWELQYHAMLFWTGIVGALFIALAAALMTNAVIRAARERPDLVPTLVVACAAAAGMLIGNATNPYLQAPGHVWSIFMPVAVANVMLMSEPTRRPNRSRVHGLRAGGPLGDGQFRSQSEGSSVIE